MEIIAKKVTFLKEDKENIINLNYCFNPRKIFSILSKDVNLLEDLTMILCKGYESNLILSESKAVTGVSFKNPENMFLTSTVKNEFNLNFRNKIESDAKISSIFEELKIDKEILNSDPFLLSNGEKKIISVAIAIFEAKELLVLENPFKGLDNDRALLLIKYLKKLRNSQDIIIIILANNTNYILEVSDDVIILSGKKSIKSGDKYSCLSDEAIMNKAGLKTPDLLLFSNMVKSKKKINIGYRDDVDDLIKDIYRYVN